MSREKFNNLTGLRGFAALWVVAHHLPILPVISNNYSTIASKGWLGVDLFFILSGFVIAYVHQEDFRELNRHGIKRFAILRFARVYPVFFVVLLAWIAIVLFATMFAPGSIPKFNFTGYKFLYQLFLLNGWGIPNSNGWNIPSWSLSAEVFAYLCFPFIAFLTVRQDKIRYLLLIYFITILLSIFLAYILNDTRKFMLNEEFTLFRVVSEFLCGLILYNIFCRATHSNVANNFLALSSFLAVLLLSFFSVPSQYDFCFILAFSGLIYFGAHANVGIANKIFGNKLILYFGKISYSIYIVHSLILMMFSQLSKKLLFPLIAKSNFLIFSCIIICTLITIVVSAHILFYKVENPSRKYIRDYFNY